jgi:hypothetical protein
MVARSAIADQATFSLEEDEDEDEPEEEDEDEPEEDEATLSLDFLSAGLSELAPLAEEDSLGCLSFAAVVLELDPFLLSVR